MDYRGLDKLAKTEGRGALRGRLERLLEQARVARERNESGETPRGLNRSIRGTRYMLGQVVKDKGVEASGNRRDNGSDDVTGHARRMGSTFPSYSNERQDQSAGNNGRIRKFGEGVEMLTPTLCNKVFFYDYEKSATGIAYEMYQGRAVRRDKHGQAIISQDISYAVVGVNEHFQKDYPHLSVVNSYDEAHDSCYAAILQLERRQRM